MTNGHAHPNEDYNMENGASSGSNLRFSSGLILPPPEIKGGFSVKES